MEIWCASMNARAISLDRNIGRKDDAPLIVEVKMASMGVDDRGGEAVT